VFRLRFLSVWAIIAENPPRSPLADKVKIPIENDRRKNMNSELQTLVSLNPLTTTIPDEATQEIISLLRSGIESAKNGNRDEAKALLFRVTDIDPDNEMAWLWLASVSEYPEELLTFLQKVLAINSENEQALEWEKSTKALLARNLVQYGITAVQESKKESAKRCFLRAIQTDANNEMAWLWMASITEDQDEKNSYLHKVLEINPENEVANTLFKIQRKDEAQDLLQKSKASAVKGNRQEALEMLEQIKQLDSGLDEAWTLHAHLAESFEEKAFCFNQALACNPDNEAARFGLASLQSILQTVNANNGGNGNGHNADDNGTASLLSPQLEEELTAPEAMVPAAEEVEEEVGEPAQQFAADDELIEQFDSFDEADDVTEEMPAQFFAAADVADVADEHESEEVAEQSSFAFDEAEEVVEQSSAPVEEVDEVVEQSAAPAEVAEVAEVAEKPVAEEASKFETLFSDEEMEESMAFLSVEEPATDEPASAFAPVSEDWNEPEEMADEALEEDEHYFDATTGDLDQKLIEEEPFAPNFAANTEESLETAMEDSSEDISEEVWEENVSDKNPVPAASFENEEAGEIKAKTFYFGSNGVDKEAAPVVEQAVEEMKAPVAAAEDLVSDEPDKQAVVEEVEEEMQLSEIPAAADQAPFAQMSVCPFCEAGNNINDEVCGGCQAVLGLHNLDLLLSQDSVDRDKISDAVADMEAELESDSFSAEDYYNLGLACLNLKDIYAGLNYLQKSYILNSTNSLLKAQIDELAKRAESAVKDDDGDMAVESVQSSAAGKVIMVVDDSATIRKLVSAKLEKHGHSVITAVDGMDALAKLEEVIPDLILLDITMPRLDGYQVCKLIRANDNTRFVPIVLISGKDGFFDKVRGKMCGSTTYITKPFGPEMLLRTVESYFPELATAEN
jgi:CheY-like chemotaxis protein